MKKAMAIVLLAFLCVGFLNATAQETRKLNMALMGAIMRGDIDEVKKLINAGADVNYGWKGSTPLSLAVRFGHADIGKLLIDAGADVNRILNGFTILHVATGYDGDNKAAKAVTELLIANGLDVNAKCTSGVWPDATPLHTAAKAGNVAAADVLIKNGATVNAEAYWHYTPLHFAAQEGHKAVAELLIAKGADVNAKSSESQYAPLHLAAREGEKAVAELLIAKGADVNAKMDNGRTPLDEAEMRDEQELVDFLRKHGGVSVFDKRKEF